jgi:quercetin dioxygenase-like cupin family protein
MSVIHKFIGKWGQKLDWEGTRSRRYDSETAKQVVETWLVGKAEKAENFAIRYYEVGAGGFTNKEQHEHDHGIIFLQGEATVMLEEEKHDVTVGDVVYIPPNALHQIINRGDEAMGFICVIPARRKKQDRVVWAEEGIENWMEK